MGGGPRGASFAPVQGSAPSSGAPSHISGGGHGHVVAASKSNGVMPTKESTNVILQPPQLPADLSCPCSLHCTGSPDPALLAFTPVAGNQGRSMPESLQPPAKAAAAGSHALSDLVDPSGSTSTSSSKGVGIGERRGHGDACSSLLGQQAAKTTLSAGPQCPAQASEGSNCSDSSSPCVLHEPAGASLPCECKKHLP